MALVCAVASIADPRGVGGVLYGLAALALIPAITFGPLGRGARPLRVWLVQTAGGLCLLVSPAAELLETRFGPMRAVDITYFSGFLFLILWLALLNRRVGHPRDQHIVVDAVAFTVGGALSLWATVLAPLVGGSGFPAGLVGMIYPTLDLLLLVLAVQLVSRLRRPVLAGRFLVVSLVLELLVDLGGSVSAVLAPTLHDPILAFSLVPFAGLAVAATDHSIVELGIPPAGPPESLRAGRPTALILFTVPPILLSTSIPPEGLVDIVVRTLLTGVLLLLLFVRLAVMLRALVAAEADSRRRATHDALTGLLNRAALMDRLDRRLQRNTETGRSTAIVFFDCDGFKKVNDTWGHAAGDTLLRDIATRLPSVLGPSEILARLGGDEFVAVSTVDGEDEARAFATRVRRFFDRPLAILPDRRHGLTPSIGLAVVPPGDPGGAEDVLARADAAMYVAKQSGQGRIALFDDELAALTRARARVGDRLEATLPDDPFTIHLMPIMGGPDYGTTMGWEALARWEDPELGTVPPEEFVPLAEQLGLIDEVGLLVLRRACRDAAALIGHVADPERREALALHVNVSPTQLHREDFPARVRAALADAGLPPHHLRLEVTETLLVDGSPDVLDVLHEVRAFGVQVCLDDFGTGYASLATLVRLPVDCVKIDRSLVADVGENSPSTRRAAAVLSLVESVGVTDVVAEGVETELQARTLQQLGCPMVQGYLYGAPAPLSALLPPAVTEAEERPVGETSPV